MDMRSEISDFLRSRRARITPEQVGLSSGRNRRVPGLRREEVAVLASISVDWYVRIERGNLAGVSDEVVRSLAQALRLDTAETTHLLDLAREARNPSASGESREPSTIRPGLQIVLDSLVGIPAWVRDRRFSLVAANPLGRALYSDIIDSPVAQGNSARFTFLDVRARTFYRDWAMGADEIVALLRGYIGAAPSDSDLSNLVGELATRSADFATRWATHDVRQRHAGVKRLRHPLVGDVNLEFEGLTLPDRPTLNLYAYHPADSATKERLQLLANWEGHSAAVPLDGARRRSSVVGPASIPTDEVG